MARACGRSLFCSARRPRAPRASRGAALAAFLIVSASPVAALGSTGDEIRPRDRITLVNGNVLEGLIVGDDPETSPTLQLRTSGGATVTLKRADISELVPRQTAEDVYTARREALRSNKERAARARAELALGLWCKAPHPVLDGAPPAADAALEHTLNAVRLDPSLCEAYGHLLSLIAARGDPSELSPEALELDVETYVLARSGDCKVTEIEYRMGMALAGPLADAAAARTLLERVLASDYENAEHRRRARSTLASLYRFGGESERAVALYEGIIRDEESAPENFEPFFELGRLHMQLNTPESDALARAYFAKAQAIQPEFLDILAQLAAIDYRRGDYTAAETHLKNLLEKHKGDLVATIDLALVRVALGRLDPAEKIFTGLLPQTSGADRARVHAGLGSIASARGRPADAAAQYRQAVALVPASLELRLLLGFALAAAGENAEARAFAERLLSESPENLAVYALASRLLAEAELAAGDPAAALVHYDRALEVSAADPLLLERAGMLLLRESRLEAGSALLERARAEIPEPGAALACALGFYHYMRGEMEKADALLVAASRAAAKEKVARFKDYAERGRALIGDLARLEVWTADIAATDGADLSGWKEIEHYGIAIERRGGKIVFAGTQDGVADGVTQVVLERPIEARTFQRLAMTARIVEGRCRFGLRLEGAARSGATAGIVFLRDLDGVARFQVKGATGDWETVDVTAETDPSKGRLVFPGTVTWPEDGKEHRLEIRRSERTAERSRSSLFDLYLDGEPVAWNVSIAGLNSPTYEVGFSAQGEAVGSRITLEMSRFAVFRLRPGQSSRRSER